MQAKLAFQQAVAQTLFDVQVVPGSGVLLRIEEGVAVAAVARYSA